MEESEMTVKIRDFRPESSDLESPTWRCVYKLY